MSAPFLLASLSTPRLLSGFGPRVLVAGAALQAAGLLILGGRGVTAWPGLSIVALAPGLAVAGAGQGLVMSPLMGVVLSDVPPSAAGVGGGVLATTQQTALALGVATLGSLFLALAGDGAGIRNGFLVVIAVQVIAAVGVAAGARRLPDRSRSPPSPLPPARPDTPSPRPAAGL